MVSTAAALLSSSSPSPNTIALLLSVLVRECRFVSSIGSTTPTASPVFSPVVVVADVKGEVGDNSGEGGKDKGEDNDNGNAVGGYEDKGCGCWCSGFPPLPLCGLVFS